MRLPSRRFLLRVLRYAVAGGILAFALLVSALRWWILPEIANYRSAIAAAITKTAGQKVTIGAISADWKGLRPHLKLNQIEVYDHSGRPALSLTQVDATLSWTTLIVAEVRLHRLEIDRPYIDVRRDPDGLIYLSGIVINDNSVHQDFADWVLRQGLVHINHATIAWRDGLRGAPPLVLNDVGLLLENRGNRHRFGLLASAPPALASTLDVRGDLHGSDTSSLQAWSGSLYANLGRTDLAAWSVWVDLPYRINQGQGGVALWTDVTQGKVSSVAAHLHLQAVKVRLGKTLPELAVAQLDGQMGWRELARGFEFQAKRLDLDAGLGRRLAMQNIYARLENATGTDLERGEFRAQNFEIAPWLALAAYMPLSEAQRTQLAAWSPQGVFKNLALSWQGPKAAPKTYALKLEFTGLGIHAVGKTPGFSNVSGNLQANQDGGNINLAGQKSVLDLPLVFRQPLQFDQVDTQASWRVREQNVQLTIAALRFANAQLSGNLSGSYETSPGTPGLANIQGRLSRADAAAVYQYLPRGVGDLTYAWVHSAILQGSSDDVRLQLKGPLAHFPFAQDRNGVFRVTASVKNGVLRYAPDWPQISNIETDLDFHGNRMELHMNQGKIFNAQINRAKIVIPELHHPDPVLEVDGTVAGDTADYLRFIAASPLQKNLTLRSDDVHAQGSGKLALSLRLPLHHMHDSQSAGIYQFSGNKLWGTLPGPILEQASGTLNFTNNGLNASSLRAQFLGGPISLTALSSADGVVRASASGRVTATALQQAYPNAWTQRLKGGADWSASAALRGGALNLNLISNLVGLSSELPYPFSKAAAENVPLKFERRFVDTRRDVLALSVGNIVAAQLQRIQDGEATRVERGQILFGAASASLPTTASIRVDGDLDRLDADLWRSLLPASSEGALPLQVNTVNLKVKTLDILGRRVNNFVLSAASHEDGWHAEVDSKELQGELSWADPEERLSAHFKNMIYPDASPAPKTSLAGGRDVNLPGLDVVIDNFQTKNTKWGRVDLAASKQGADWHIDKLQIKNPDAVFQAEGLWQSWLAQPQTKLTIDLDVKDIGKFFTRLGYPERIKAGTAKLSGNVNWRGGPQEFALANVRGDLKLEAHRGQFMRLDPGVGKLLGLLSLQSLPRRLTLDFRDVFSEGFAFDNILGILSLNQGILATNDFVMQGPAAVVSMNGSTDLDKETQNLRVKVVPVVGDSVSLLAFLGGPAVGIGTYVLQKLLKDPLGKMVAYDYAVTGSWENPTVVKLDGKAREATP